MYYLWEAISQVYTWITIHLLTQKKKRKKNHLQKICSNKSKREKFS